MKEGLRKWENILGEKQLGKFLKYMKRLWKFNQEKFFNLLSLGFILLYTIAALTVVLNRYWQFQDYYLDFGVFDMAIWKVSRFMLPYIDHVDYGVKNIFIFANHFNPSIFLFSPLFWITNRSEVLLIAQTLCVSVAAYIGLNIAKNILKDGLAVFALVFAFLGYVGLQNALITDFHDATVIVLPMMILFWSFLKSKWKLYFLCLIIILGFKESFAGFGVALSVFVLIKNRKFWKISLATFLISFFWGYISIKYLIPYFAEGKYFFMPQSLPNNLVDFVSSFYTPILRFKTIVYSYLTFGFLPIFNLSVLPMIFENFFERYVLSNGKGIDLGMHYNAPLSPIMFMGSLLVFVYMQKRKILKRLIIPYSIFIILTVIILHRFVLRGPLGLFYNPIFYKQNSAVSYVNNFINQIPKNGLIMTQNDLATRFTHNNVKLLRSDYESINPDVVALNLTPGQNPNSYFPLSLKQTKDLRDSLIRDDNYSLEKFADELYLFKKINK